MSYDKAHAVRMLCHDPRISDDREHRVETTNIELHAREMMRQKYPAMVIDWEAVKAEADAIEGRSITSIYYDDLGQPIKKPQPVKAGA